MIFSIDNYQMMLLHCFNGVLMPFKNMINLEVLKEQVRKGFRPLSAIQGIEKILLVCNYFY